jgi:hypothetical protein
MAGIWGESSTYTRLYIRDVAGSKKVRSSHPNDPTYGRKMLLDFAFHHLSPLFSMCNQANILVPLVGS